MVLQGLQLSDPAPRPAWPTTWPSTSTTPCRSTPTCRRRRPRASSCTSTSTTCSCCSSTGASGGGCGSRWPAPASRCAAGRKEPMPTFDELGEPALDLTLRGRRLPVPAARLPARRRDRRRGVVAPDDRRDGAGVAPGRAPRRRRGGRRAGRARCAASIPADASPVRPTSTAVAAAPRSRRPSRRVDGRARCGSASRRPGCGRWHPPTIELTTAADRDARSAAVAAARPASRVELGLGDRVADDAGRGRTAAGRRAASDGPFTLADLDVALDDASRLVVGQRLVTEGVVAPV